MLSQLFVFNKIKNFKSDTNKQQTTFNFQQHTTTHKDTQHIKHKDTQSTQNTQQHNSQTRGRTTTATTTRCPLFLVRCSLFVVRCLLFAVCCLLSAVCCLLSAVCCLLFAVCCLLFAVCCLLFAWRTTRSTRTTTRTRTRPLRQEHSTKNEAPSTHRRSSIGPSMMVLKRTIHVTFHNGFTPQTNIQHFTGSHTGIGNHLCLCTRRHQCFEKQLTVKTAPVCK